MVSLFIFFLAIIPYSVSHSWVERLMRLEQNGTMVGQPGYVRGAVSRLSPYFSDFDMQFLVLDIQDQICKETQRTKNYSHEYPALRARPGDFIALQYQENGHVTLPENSPHKLDSGRVYVYGTSSPLLDERISRIHKVWNVEGTGGDRRGQLLSVWDFDDGQCYQINTDNISVYRQNMFAKAAMNPQGADLWCQIDVHLPRNIEGWYTLYWVWDWPTTVGVPRPMMEIYTSCMDIELTSGPNQNSVQFIRGQDLNWAGVEDQMINESELLD